MVVEHAHKVDQSEERTDRLPRLEVFGFPREDGLYLLGVDADPLLHINVHTEVGYPLGPELGLLYVTLQAPLIQPSDHLPYIANVILPGL